MKKFWIGIVFMISGNAGILFAQGEIEEQSEIFYQNERTFAILLNSNGFGGNFRYAKRMTELRKTIYDIDFVGIKHPREAKISTDNFYFKRIVYGKLNDFYNLRLGIGLQKEMFSKADKGGIAIRPYYSLGASIGFAKPIYYNIDIIGYDANNQPYRDSSVVEKFTHYQHIQSSVISGKASFFKGFKETSVIPGLHGKLGVMFEFGKSPNIIHAIDAGIIVDAFLKEIEIMATEDNHQVFLSLFVSYRFGKVIDAKYKPKKSKIDEILPE